MLCNGVNKVKIWNARRIRVKYRLEEKTRLRYALHTGLNTEQSFLEMV